MSHRKLWIRARASRARANGSFDELPNGYNTQLGDDDVRLSGGQRQWVALARALLKDADVLVLDEATSGLESHIEEQVQERIERLDLTMIVIANRLSTVVNADRINVIEGVEIVETGSHDALIELGESYANMYEAHI